ncbi:MAG: ElyC/SanA/YdcF family protein [Anaerolineaceae bacterium]
MKKTLRIALLAIFIPSVLILAIRFAIVSYASDKIFEANIVQNAPVVIVPGAGLTRAGTPSAALGDRLDEAIKLYQAGKVQKLLLSGDNRFIDYNEPGSMREYCLAQGIPDADIVLDFAGRRTYDTCYRAKVIFGVEQAIIVTQQYHLSRAVFLCDQLGIEVKGVAVDQSDYIPERYAYWQFREVFATVSAAWDIFVGKPLPVLGEAEPIFPEN